MRLWTLCTEPFFYFWGFMCLKKIVLILCCLAVPLLLFAGESVKLEGRF